MYYSSMSKFDYLTETWEWSYRIRISISQKLPIWALAEAMITCFVQNEFTLLLKEDLPYQSYFKRLDDVNETVGGSVLSDKV